MTLSLSKLQECAERATPGPWTSEDNIVWKDGESIALDCVHLDASFIALFNPETAKALIRVASAALESQAKFMSITDMAMPNGGCVPPEFLPISIALKEISE